MPTFRYFDKVPAFSTDVALAPTATLSLKKLQNGSERDSARLYEAARQWGFFLVDLKQSDEGEALLRDAEKMFDLTTETFALDQATLQSYAYTPPHDLTGYDCKRLGGAISARTK